MTPAGPPPGPVLAAWHRRFSNRIHLWTGSIRLWRADLPVPQTGSPSRLAEWVARAAALGSTRPTDLARRLGVPEAVIAAAGGRPARQAFAFLDLPGGPVPVSVPAGPVLAWPEPISAETVPEVVVRPPGVEVSPRSADWRTVPVVRADGLNAVAVDRGYGIEVYPTGPDWEIGESPAWRLPAGAIPAATPEAWAAAWREWCRANGIAGAPAVTVENGVARVSVTSAGGWLWVDGGPLREGAVIVSA